MKKIYLVSSVLLLTLSSGVAFAETSTSTMGSTTREKVNVRLQEVKNKIASTTEALKSKRDEKKSDIENRIGKKLEKEREKIANAFENAIRNLKSLADRVEARIVKLESRGHDLSSQKVLLTDARTKITIADTELTAFENSLASTSASTSTRKVILKQIKIESEKTKAAIKAAHRAIVNVINSLKPGREKDKESNATSTESNATSSTSTTSTSTNQ